MSKMMLVPREVVRRLSLKRGSAYVVDPEIQSRVKLDPANLDHLRGELALCGDLRPVDVMFDGKNYYLWDGFHRDWVYRRANRPDIPAIVTEGTRQDAIIASAKNNQGSSLKKTMEDRERSVLMLLEFDEWLKKPLKQIEEYCGISSIRIKKLIAQFEQKTGKQRPEVIQSSSGQSYPAKRSFPKPEEREIRRGRNGSYLVRRGGRTNYYGKDKEAATRALDDSRAEIASLRSCSSLYQFLVIRDIPSELISFCGNFISALIGSGFAAHPAVSEANGHSFLIAFGRVLMTRSKLCSSGRAVIVCEPKTVPDEVRELARPFGVEFLSPTEFVASIKGQA